MSATTLKARVQSPQAASARGDAERRSSRPVAMAVSEGRRSAMAGKCVFFGSRARVVGRGECGRSSGRRSRCEVVRMEAAVAEKSTVKTVFPFTQIVGQEDMKLGLMLNIVEPALGGVLVMGDRGTGKSLSVRALAAITPEIDVVVDDPYNSSPTNIRLMGPEAEKSFKAGETLKSKKMQIPLVELPLGATEDRVCGTIDIERALTEGVKAYEPGLLAKANQGILYVDEVNLLEDSLVDVVLDSAASGWNTVEREGVSVGHPASFILVGSGTESQGELRPQLLDRFGLSVKANTITDADDRVDLVIRRTAYEKDPKAFVAENLQEGAELTAKLTAARQLMKETTIDRDLSLKISEICSMLNVDGLRGDIVTNRAARAHAALNGRKEATQADIERVVVACLAHRLRKDVMDSADGNEYKVVIAYRKVFGGFVGAAPAAAAAAPEPKEKEEKEEKPVERKAGAWDPSKMIRK